MTEPRALDLFCCAGGASAGLPACDHGRWAPRFPSATNRKNLRRTVEVGVWRIPVETQRAAMGIAWMSTKKLSQAIPPAYSEWLGRAALAYILKGKEAA